MAKKTASKKKRTAAQKRATEKLVAANRKKRASKKKASARTGSVSTGRRRSAAKVRGYPGGARRTNPKERWTDPTVRYMIVYEKEDGGRIFVRDDGSSTLSAEAAALFKRQDDAKSVAEQVNTKGYNARVYVARVEIKFNKNDLEAIRS